MGDSGWLSGGVMASTEESRSLRRSDGIPKRRSLDGPLPDPGGGGGKEWCGLLGVWCWSGEPRCVIGGGGGARTAEMLAGGVSYTWLGGLCWLLGGE